MEAGDVDKLRTESTILKKRAFELVATKPGKLLDPTVLTIVWARRFAKYKRPDLLNPKYGTIWCFVKNTEHQVQI